MIRLTTVSTLALTASLTSASAQTEVQWQHAMGVKLEVILAGCNASQSGIVVVPTFKGTYPET